MGWDFPPLILWLLSTLGFVFFLFSRGFAIPGAPSLAVTWLLAEQGGSPPSTRHLPAPPRGLPPSHPMEHTGIQLEEPP